MWCRCDIIVDCKFRCPCWRCTLDGWMDLSKEKSVSGLEAAYKQPAGQVASCMPELPLWRLFLSLSLSSSRSVSPLVPYVSLSLSLSLPLFLTLFLSLLQLYTPTSGTQHTLPTGGGCWTGGGGLDERPENQQVANLQHEPENKRRK